MRYPCLKINLSSISRNCKIINDRCTGFGITVVGVLKCVLGDTKIARVLKDNGIDAFGDSRLANLEKLREHFKKSQKLIMLRTPMISEIGRMIDICDVSMNTQIETVAEISRLCSRRNITHSIIIMVETDDRREGLMPGEVTDFCDSIIRRFSNIEIYGIGTNARCISDKKPLPESIRLLTSLKEKIEKKCSIRIPVVSGGNSSIWKLLDSGMLPRGVNQVRMGEIILLGHETSNYEPIKNGHTDAFSLEAEVIEVKRKNGSIYKIIAALGLQDIDFKDMICDDDSLEMADQSSDHTVMLVRKKKFFKPGDIITFRLNYFGILSCMTSPFVEKIYVSEL